MMTELEQQVLEQLQQAGAAGRSHREIAQALGKNKDEVWVALSALMFTGHACRRDVGRETVWSVVKATTGALASVKPIPAAEPDSAPAAPDTPPAVQLEVPKPQLSVPKQVAKLLAAAGAAGKTAAELAEAIGQADAVKSALQFHRKKGQVDLVDKRWIWQANSTPIATTTTTPEPTMQARQAKTADAMPFNCLLDANGQLHLDLENGETLCLPAEDTRKLARFMQLITPALEAMPACA